MNQNIIEFSGVKKYVHKQRKESLRDYFFGSGTQTSIIDIPSWNVPVGSKVGIVGSNGSGKSTLLKLCSGILQSSEGSVKLFGLDPVKKRKKVSSSYGIVFGQRTQLRWDLPAIETYKVLRVIYDISKKDYQVRLDRLIEQLQLQDILYQPVRTLSLGQRVRVELGSVFLHDPTLLILDEPTIGLDTESKKLIINCVKNWYTDTKVLLLTSHNFSDIVELCDSLVVLRSGSIEYQRSMISIVDRFRKFCNVVITLSEENEKVLSHIPYKQVVMSDGIEIQVVPRGEVSTLIREASARYQILSFYEESLRFDQCNEGENFHV